MPSVGPMNGGLKNGSVNSYYQVVATVASNAFYTYTAPSGSGGSPQVVNTTNLTVFDYANVKVGNAVDVFNTSSLLTVGNLVRDMGKTVVASGSTFRKIQLLPNNVSSLTLNGSAVTSTGVQGSPTGALTGYVQMPNDNTNATTPNVARLVRLY